MGDNGKMYVPKELIPIYKESILPIATILTPNLFEAELLTDIKITREEDIWQAIAALHSTGIETVCVSSAELPASVDKLYIFASSRKGQFSIRKRQFPLIIDLLTFRYPSQTENANPETAS